MPTTSAPYAAGTVTALPPDARRMAERWRDWVRQSGRLILRHGQAEWFGSPVHLMTIARPRANGVAASPRSPRPADPARGAQMMTGRFELGGLVMQVGPGGDPFDRPSPNRAFAEALHAFDWMPDLLAVGQAGEKEALRLALDWRRVFGRWNNYSWSGRPLERRCIQLARGLRPIAAQASELEVQQLADSLARQGRQLLLVADGPARAAERACAAALAGSALAGPAGERLMSRALARLDTALAQSVLADGGHASRSPQAGLDLLADLLTLDDGLSQRGRAQPPGMSRAIDRLAAALRFFTMADGRLPCFQGGEAGHAAEIAAVRAASDLPEGSPPGSLPQSGYHRMTSRRLTLIADAAAPAAGPWSEAATAQPGALEICCGPDRLVTNTAWSALSGGPQAHRLTGAGSTLEVGDRSAGEPIGGRLGRLIGPRLRDTAKVEAVRHEAPQGTWLEISHDGWAEAFGLRHERRLYLDRNLDELRGEEKLVPTGLGDSLRSVPVAIHFHLPPEVGVWLARDQHSVLIQGRNTPAWWLRNDAGQVSVEPSVHYEDGLPHRSSQIVLRCHAPLAKGLRVRWKLARVEANQPPPKT